jgi:hypothetical protein
MAQGAHRRQQLIVWGTGTSKTVEVELYAIVVSRRRVVGNGILVHYYYYYYYYYVSPLARWLSAMLLKCSRNPKTVDVTDTM